MINLYPRKKRLTLEEFEKIVLHNERIELDPKARADVHNSFEFLKEFSKNKIIYGVNTGFGPMAPYRIEEKDSRKLQINLIRSHACGTGKYLDDDCTRAAMLARLNTILLGYSGVNKSVIRVLEYFINENILPRIYEHGGVGASGDLVQLAHIALTLIGEGYIKYEGKEYYTGDIMRHKKIQPIDIIMREGLALINGTSVMTGISMLNLIKAKNLLKLSVLFSAMINEITNSYDDHYSKELNQVKQHDGQNEIAGAMRNILSDSKLIRKRSEHLYKGKTDKVLKDRVQEYYSLRCVPQILGPVYDTLKNAQKVLENEINSVNDNPIIDAEKQNVFHGGNFHGDYISFEADKMKIAVTKMSMLVERQLNFLMNNKINQILPPFLNLGTLGLNLGMQGVQFTAVSTTAENQTLSNPMYIHSIPNNNDNQDIVSMGTNAALITKKVIDNTYQIMAVHLISIAQAIDYLGIEEKMSSKTQNLYRELRKIVPGCKEDTPKFEELSMTINYLKTKIADL